MNEAMNLAISSFIQISIVPDLMHEIDTRKFRITILM